mgnify:CR=1 FL=1
MSRDVQRVRAIEHADPIGGPEHAQVVKIAHEKCPSPGPLSIMKEQLLPLVNQAARLELAKHQIGTHLESLNGLLERAEQIVHEHKAIRGRQQA